MLNSSLPFHIDLWSVTSPASIEIPRPSQSQTQLCTDHYFGKAKIHAGLTSHLYVTQMKGLNIGLNNYSRLVHYLRRVYSMARSAVTVAFGVGTVVVRSRTVPIFFCRNSVWHTEAISKEVKERGSKRMKKGEQHYPVYTEKLFHIIRLEEKQSVSESETTTALPLRTDRANVEKETTTNNVHQH